MELQSRIKKNVILRWLGSYCLMSQSQYYIMYDQFLWRQTMIVCYIIHRPCTNVCLHDHKYVTAIIRDCVQSCKSISADIIHCQCQWILMSFAAEWMWLWGARSRCAIVRELSAQLAHFFGEWAQASAVLVRVLSFTKDLELVDLQKLWFQRESNMCISKQRDANNKKPLTSLSAGSLLVCCTLL